MSTKIEWTNATVNVITGCTQYSEGCQNCYAKAMHKRLTAMGLEKYKEPFNKVVCHNIIMLNLIVRNIINSKLGDEQRFFSELLFDGSTWQEKGIQMANSTKKNRIRVSLKAYDHKLIDVSAEKIVETAKRTDAKVAGPIPLPTKRRIYCVLRSPHVDKKSREHFEMRTHKRIIDIYETTQQTKDEVFSMDLPSGVDIEVKL